MEKAAEKSLEIALTPLEQAVIEFYVLGDSPIILNRMSQKAAHELLFPNGRKNAVERATTFKHVPRDEFRASPYIVSSGPTALCHLATCFKAAICGAALDMPGTNKAQIGRLLHAVGEWVPIIGTPKLHMGIVRSADMNHTPDVRTRAIVPEWASIVRLKFVRPLLNENTVATLLSAAGMIQGIGDFRPGKGKGTFGQFHIVPKDNPDFLRIVNSTTHQSQMQAMQAAEPYDAEAAEMLTWFDSEVIRRNRQPTSAEAVEKAEEIPLATENEE